MSLLTEILLLENIKFLRSRDKLYAIKELLDLISEELGWRDRLNILEALMLREEFESTALSFSYVALPHIHTNLVNGIKCAVGISKEGVDFRARNGELTNFIILTLISPDQKQLYLSFLNHITQLVSDKELMLDLSMAISPEEIWELFSMAENRYPLLPCYVGRTRNCPGWE